MILPYRDILPTIPNSCFVAESCDIMGQVRLGEDVGLWYRTVLRGDVNHIEVGDATNIQDGSVIHVTRLKYPTIIGPRVTVGHSATLHGCVIDEGCLIGMGAVILDDARIGEWSFVAAGSLVTPSKKFPPKSMIMGSPAKVTRPLTDEELAGLEQSWKNYVELKDEYKAAGLGLKQPESSR